MERVKFQIPEVIIIIIIIITIIIIINIIIIYDDDYYLFSSFLMIYLNFRTKIFITHNLKIGYDSRN